MEIMHCFHPTPYGVGFPAVRFVNIMRLNEKISNFEKDFLVFPISAPF